MMGRAGRPQYDKHGVAVIMVYEPKKSFYKKFLYEPFPVESSLPAVLPDHINAEIASGTICSTHDAVDYLTWTFFMRRLIQNPSYYDLESVEPAAVSAFLVELVDDTLHTLADAGCIALNGNDEEDARGGGDGDTRGKRAMTQSTVYSSNGRVQRIEKKAKEESTSISSSSTTTTLYTIKSLSPGKIASFYYLKHSTMAIFSTELSSGLDSEDIIRILCDAAEYSELPVRHNEDNLNAGMLHQVRYPPDKSTVDDPHTKASLLVQAHLGRVPLPISDYVTDTRSVLDNSLRIIQAMVDVCADAGWLDTTLAAMRLVQGLMRGRWHDEDALMQLPGVETGASVDQIKEIAGVESMMELLERHRSNASSVMSILEVVAGTRGAKEARSVLDRLPGMQLTIEQPTLHENGTCSIDVDIECVHGSGRAKSAMPPRVYAPLFPKIKEEGWWLMAGVPETNDLLALKRVSVVHKSRAKLVVPSIDACGKKVPSIVVYLVSDSYQGLDREHTVDLP